MSFFVIKNICKTFKNNNIDFYALNEINLSFPNKGLFFICGKSGSGKSTLLNIMAMIEKPSSGEVLYNRNNIFKYNKKERNHYHNSIISIVFQHYNLFEEFDCRYNVSLPLQIKGLSKKIIDKKVEELFRHFNMSAYLSIKVKNLSGGEKQRVAIMRSLINNPKIILCDEPSGALDSKNSILLMELLKEVAKNKLVIVVSHNEKLINSYSNQIVFLNNGKIVKSTTKPTIEKPTQDKESIYFGKAKKRWQKNFIVNFFKRDFKKNIMCFISSCIALTSTLLCVGFYVGSNKSINEYKKKSLEYQNAIIQEKTYQKIDGSPLNIVKIERPNKEKIGNVIHDIQDATIELNFSALLSSFPTLQINNVVQEPVQFIPIFSIVLKGEMRSLISNGNSPNIDNLDEVIVNKTFSDKYFMNENPINKLISIKSDNNIKYPIEDPDKQYINDKFLFDKKLKIAAVVDEFSFMNQPKIYYSYIACKEYMRNYKLKEISEYLNKNFTCFDLVNTAKGNNIYSAYSFYLFVHKFDDVNKLFSLIESIELSDNNIKITSDSYTITLAYNNLVNSFSLSMIIFVIIALAGVVCIFSISSYASFIEKKKEAAILTVLGAKENDIIDIFLCEQLIVGTISTICSLALSVPLEIFFSNILNGKFGIESMIQIPYTSMLDIPLLLPVCIFTLNIIATTISVIVPLKTYRKFSLSSELRDE